MHRKILAAAITLFAMSIVIGCSRNQSDAVPAIPVIEITQHNDDIACFLGRKLPAADRLAAADRLETDKAQIDLILAHVPEFLAIAQSGDEPQSIRCRALQMLTVCACVHPREGCESAVLSVVNDESANRIVRAAGAILLFQLPAANWDIDFLMEIILHNSVPENFQEEAIETSIPLFLVAPDRGPGLCRRLLKIARTNDIYPSVRSAALNGLEFHGVPWITDNEEWTFLRNLGDAAMTLLLDNEQHGQVRQAAVGVAGSVLIHVSDQAADDWNEYGIEFVKALRQILMNEAESEEMRTAAAKACGFLGKFVTKELVSAFETGLFTGGPATQRHVMEAVAACNESRDLWLPVIDRYIEDATRDSDVRSQATTVRRTVGLKTD